MAPGELSAGPAAPLSSGKKEKGKEMAVQKVSMSIQNEEVRVLPPLQSSLAVAAADDEPPSLSLR